MTLDLRGGMSEIVCRNTFCTFGTKLRTIDLRGEGAKVYTFGKVSSLVVQKFQ